MSTVDLKMNSAIAAYKMIVEENATIIGLGAGKTISNLVGIISETLKDKVKIVTPSVKTRMLCLEAGLDVLHLCSTATVDLAFDGCDEVDESFAALKSGGGIHTVEKLVASMAKNYVLLVDKTKYTHKLTFKHPVVLEVLEDALSYVLNKAAETGGKPVIRSSSSKDGFTITENGNVLVDVYYDQCHSINYRELESKLIKICGVVETSLFIDVVSRIIVSEDSGDFIFEKK